MPYKDKQKRYDAINKSVAKKPHHYRMLSKLGQRRSNRINYQLLRRYGISFDQREQMIAAQDDACFICGIIPKKSKSGRSGLHIDHNHSTKAVRKMLCMRCNTIIGFMEKESWPNLSKKVDKYLEDHS